MTEEQEFLVNSIIDKNVVFSNSEAGTGKTTMAFAALYYLWEKRDIDKIYYIFSPVQEDKMGFRPGSQEEKEADYADPILGAVAKVGLMPEKVINERGMLKIKSHTFLRGQDHERIGVIIDEAQNYTKEELKKTMTRLHENCHVVVIGHSKQIDLKKPENSGFVPMMELFSKREPERSAVAPLTKNFRGWISRVADSLE